MRVLAFLVLVFLSACINEDPVPAFIAMDYQVRCIGSCMEARDGEVHRISNVDGEDGLRLSCGVIVEDGERLLNFRVSCPGGDATCGENDYSLEIREISLAQLADGSEVTDPGTRCEVTVEENNTTYRGACTGDDPDPEGDRPCRVRLGVDGTYVEGTLFCEELSAPLAPTAFTRFLVAPSASDSPADFTLEGCVGL